MAAIAVTGAWHGSNRSKLYEEIGRETLTDRRMYRRILQLYKMISGMTPAYLSDKLPPRRRPFLFSANTTLLFREIRCRSSRYMNSFFPDAISTWNRIIDHFVEMPSIGKFKEHVISLIRPSKKSTFNIYDPIGLRYIFQLRLNLSPLRSHKWRHNFLDTSSEFCQCAQGVEDTEHFLFLCPLFDNQR